MEQYYLIFLSVRLAALGQLQKDKFKVDILLYPHPSQAQAPNIFTLLSVMLAALGQLEQGKYKEIWFLLLLIELLTKSLKNLKSIYINEWNLSNSKNLI